MSTCFIWGAFLLYALILLWQKMAVNLHAAHKKTDLHAAHKALLACFLLSCANYYSRFTHVHLPLISDYSKIICAQCTKIARLQYTKLTCVQPILSHACCDSSHDKNWRTHACSPHAGVNLDVSCTVHTYVCTFIKTHSGESWGQEEAACMHIFKPTWPLQWVIYTDGSSKIRKHCT